MESNDQLEGIGRFVSAVAAALRVFNVYRGDNQSLDEMLQNVIRRFESLGLKRPLRLSVTRHALLWNGQPAGLAEITAPISGLLLNLGFRALSFQEPLQKRQFTQFFTILNSRDTAETKIEKLNVFLEDGEAKPISLTPLTVRSTALRLPDEVILKRLRPLLAAKADGGSGFIEDLSGLNVEDVQDLLIWISARSAGLQGPERVFVQSLVDAVTEGFFPTERFLRLFPLPEAMRSGLQAQLDHVPRVTARRRTKLQQSHLPARRAAAAGRSRWKTWAVTFSGEEASVHQEFRVFSADQAVIDDLELAEALTRDSEESNLVLGLSFLSRILSDKNGAVAQEKAVQIGLNVWRRLQAEGPREDSRANSLLSALRHALTLPANVSLGVFPMRSAQIDSEPFRMVTENFVSLGEHCLKPLIAALETEVDRGMRKKLCELIMHVARKWGAGALTEAIPSASSFLARNLLMILGDLRHAGSLALLSGLATHPQKIVRLEAVRSISKIGTEDATETLRSILSRNPDFEVRHIALDYFVMKKHRSMIPALIALAKDESAPRPWRRSLYMAIAAFGGSDARNFLESINKGSSFLSQLSSEGREDQTLIRSLLNKLL